MADDFIKNDGTKFLELMENMAESKMKQTDMEDDVNDYDSKDDSAGSSEEWNDGYDDEDDYDEDDNDDEENSSQHDYESMSESERTNEGRRMFQIFAAKMFEQRVLHAYHEKV